MAVRVGPCRRLNTEELMHLSCGVGEDLRVSWTARRSNQSILKEISPEYSLEGLMLNWTDSLEKTLMLEKTEGRRRRGWQRTRWLDGISGHEFEKTLGDGEGQGSLACCSPWVAKSHTGLSDWTTTTTVDLKNGTTTTTTELSRSSQSAAESENHRLWGPW